jgi:transcriptional regulator with PAS, ATPase and Fis domain
VEESAGEVESLLRDSDWLEELVATVLDPARSDPGESGGIAFREDAMGIRVDGRHVLVLALGEPPPTDLELRAVRAALRTLFAGGARGRAVRPPAAGEDAEPGEEGDGEPAPGVVGSSPAFLSVLRRAAQFARHGEPVMILGESGTGKEILARLIHEHSERRRGPFVAVNCAAMPADLIEAELFGVTRGAATGVGERPGKFQAAEGGTFFLDEVGDLPLELQGKLLRVIEAGEYFRVGDDRPRRCDVRIVSATNRDLPAAVREGRFRADLFYRLHVFVLEVPPLRERRSDIPLLINHFLAQQGERMGRRVRGVSVRALRALMAYDWPGNVRELRSEVTRILAAVVDGAVIDLPHLSSDIRAAGRSGTEPGDLERFTGLPLAEAVAEFERRVILRTLEECGGNRTRVAELLGLTRAGFFKKMRRLGLIPEGADSRG